MTTLQRMLMKLIHSILLAFLMLTLPLIGKADGPVDEGEVSDSLYASAEDDILILIQESIAGIDIQYVVPQMANYSDNQIEFGTAGGFGADSLSLWDWQNKAKRKFGSMEKFFEKNKMTEAEYNQLQGDELQNLYNRNFPHRGLNACDPRLIALGEGKHCFVNYEVSFRLKQNLSQFELAKLKFAVWRFMDKSTGLNFEGPAFLYDKDRNLLAKRFIGAQILSVNWLANSSSKNKVQLLVRAGLSGSVGYNDINQCETCAQKLGLSHLILDQHQEGFAAFAAKFNAGLGVRIKLFEKYLTGLVLESIVSGEAAGGNIVNRKIEGNEKIEFSNTSTQLKTGGNAKLEFGKNIALRGTLMNEYYNLGTRGDTFYADKFGNFPEEGSKSERSIEIEEKQDGYYGGVSLEFRW